jgi:long-chain acyl-CoA synthetase
VPSVRELTVPLAVDVPAGAALPDLVTDAARDTPDHVQLRRRRGDTWQDVTCRELLDEVCAVARGLVAAGVGPGDRVGIMSRTRAEWTVADLATWFAGAVPVPVYETSSAEQVAWVLGDSGAVGCFVESRAHAETVGAVRDRLPGLREVWVLDDDALGDLTAAGTDVDDAELVARRATLRADSLATLIYTSGTTGRPKGCMLTHGNLLAGTRNALAVLQEVFGADSSTLLFLPLAHVFARVIEVGCLASGVALAHAPDTTTLLTDLAASRPTFILSVPRVFEKVFNGAQAKARAESKGRVFDQAAAHAIAYSQALDKAGGPGLPLRVQHALYDRFVFSRLREALGGRTRTAVSGGAPLGARLGHFFRGIGVTVLEGYGLTETTAAATLNTTEHQRVGSVGRPIPGCGVRIADDGEVLLKGPHVFVGYWHDDEATAAAFDADGWFRTGDLGALDDDGYLTITGRKKEIIVTSAGKNVAPAPLEDAIRAHPLVSQCVVVGDERPYVGALITLDAEALPGWLTAQHRSPGTAAAELVDDSAVRAALSAAVDRANAAVSKAEAVKRFAVLPVDFTEAAGHLTPTLKLRRDVVLRDFAADVDALYA